MTTQKQLPGASSAGSATSFKIPNMDCRNEEAAIRARLAEIPGVESLAFDLPQRRLTVVHTLATVQPLLDALTGIGMKAILEVSPNADTSSSCGAPCASSCGAARIATSTAAFTVSNMDCRDEEKAIRARLEGLDGVKGLSFDFPTRRLEVSHTLPSSESILTQLREIGMDARLAGAVVAPAATPVAKVPPPDNAISACCPCGTSTTTLSRSATGNTTQFVITNMDCPTEEALIRKRLGRVEGVDQLDFDLINRRLAVQHRLGDPAPVLDALRDIGMKATVEREAGASPKGQACASTSRDSLSKHRSALLSASSSIRFANAVCSTASTTSA